MREYAHKTMLLYSERDSDIISFLDKKVDSFTKLVKQGLRYLITHDVNISKISINPQNKEGNSGKKFQKNIIFKLDEDKDIINFVDNSPIHFTTLVKMGLRAIMEDNGYDDRTLEYNTAEESSLTKDKDISNNSKNKEDTSQVNNSEKKKMVRRSIKMGGIIK